MSDKTPTNLSSHGSQEPKSTTPIALRTRRCETQVSFYKAAQLKQCKICPSSFSTIIKLRAHVVNHKPNTKRRKAIEAIDFILNKSGKHHPSPTCSKPKTEAAPKNLFQKLFPETCREAIVASNKFNNPIVNKIHDLKDKVLKKSSSHSSQLEIVPYEVHQCMNDLLHLVVSEKQDCNTTPALTSILQLQEDLMLSTSSSSDESITESLHASTPIHTGIISPPQHLSTLSFIESLVQAQTPSNSPLQILSTNTTSPQEICTKNPTNTTIENESPYNFALHNNVPTTTSPQEDSHNICTKNPILTTIENEIQYNSPLHNNFPTTTSPQENSLKICTKNPIHTKIENDIPYNSPLHNSFSITTSPQENNHKNSNPNSIENEISILDIILTNSQESLDVEVIRNSTSPLKISQESTSNNNPWKDNSIESFHSAAIGCCKICSKTIKLEHFLQHLYQHKPGPLRAKCLKGFRSAFPPNKLPIKKPTTSRKQMITTIEQTFREKFPDLPIFQDCNTSSNSSSDEYILLEKMDSPPTAPPPISPFKKDLYSRVVKKGLCRCQFCEKSFITEEGANRHKASIHGIPPHKTVASLFPDCAPKLCRVCCKGPAPYTSIADHYKFIHNLAINAQVQPGPIDTIHVPANNFVSTKKKHVRNFISHELSSVSSKPVKPHSQPPKDPPNNKNFIQTRVYNNLKIVARPELRGTGPAKIVSMPILKHNSNTPSPSTIPPKLIVQAEVHHGPGSLGPNRSNSSLKCTLCSFLAIKHCGLRLHYYQVHGLRKIPPSCNSKEKLVTTSSSNSKSLPPDSSIAKVSSRKSASSSTKCPNTYLDPLMIYPSSTKGIPSKSASTKISNPSTKDFGQRKESKKVSFPSCPKVPDLPPLKITQAPPKPVPALTRSSQEDFASRPASRTLPTVSSSNSSSRPGQVSFLNKSLQYSFPLCSRLDCPVKGCSASFGTKHWYHTNASIKKHLTVFHQCKPSAVKYWCSICSSNITKHPANHPCLSGNLIINSSAIDDSLWNCSLCNFTANNPTAKRNHLTAHKRNSFKLNASSLKIPPHTRFSKAKRNQRITEPLSCLKGKYHCILQGLLVCSQ
ncbi:hypothetical protein NPIL_433431 [Nephila pilipes]|uniref:C2H2-type domain-containing protein n=1 Tax=Nephila pilipes TaxID=299642 RepID=A0A8X6TDX3_NEPPI|nr:hypothetical protein NPIL_433431 [Nephila pilipes]